MSKQSYPIARGVVIPLPQGGYRAVAGIFAEAKSTQQQTAVNQYLDNSVATLALMLISNSNSEEMQKTLDIFCDLIEKKYGIICRGVVAGHFIGLQYKSNGRIYKEGIPRE